MRIKNLRRSRRAVVATSLCAILMVFASLQSERVAGQRRAPQRSVASSNAQAQTQRQTTARPRLVLLIVVDQFRYDYLERFGDLFTANGLGRLMRDGASWTEANYDHMPTYTAPGHATLLTGAWPAETGIVSNEWLDRDAGKNVTSVSDDGGILFDGGEGEKASSPRRLMASTVGDELRITTNDRSKVIGISLKDRAAILPAGRHANAAYWFSTWSGHMVSSNYYFTQLPAWVRSFNEAKPTDKYFGAKWERLLPEAEYEKRMGADAPPWENIGNVPGDTNTFPHTITGGAKEVGKDFYAALDYSPFSNEMLLSFAEQAIANEHLGEDADTDVLSLSFSANDYVGHRYGAYSQEMMDVTLRVDRQIGALLDFVDRRVGLKNTVVVFTADHGVSPIPEHASAMGLPGGRIQAADVLRAIRLAISARYNPKNQNPDPTADYVQVFGDKEGFYNGNLYFNRAALIRDGVSEDEIEVVAGEAALTVPGISRYFTRAQLMRRAVSETDPVARRVLHGFYPRRSGDVIVVYEPYKYLLDTWITPGHKTTYTWLTATHGSPYSYDTHVPLIIMGAGVRSGRYSEAAMPSDIAPTLAAMLRIQKPSNSVGRILTEALTNAAAQR